MRTATVTPRDVFQQVAVTASHLESAVFSATTKRVQLVSTVDAYVAFGTSPVADSTGYYLVAKVPQLFGVNPNEKVSTLRVGGADGVLAVAEGSNI